MGLFRFLLGRIRNTTYGVANALHKRATAKVLKTRLSALPNIAAFNNLSIPLNRTRVNNIAIFAEATSYDYNQNARR
jgi:hypothetical protein